MKSSQRMFAILDVLDDHGEFTALSLVSDKTPRSSVYRNIRSLIDAGLVQNVGGGVYAPGPRYKRQPPGTRFDRQHRRQMQIMLARKLMEDTPFRGLTKKRKEVAGIMGIGVGTLIKMLKEGDA